MVAPTAPVSPPRKSSRGARNAKPVHTSSRARACLLQVPHFKTVTRHRLVVEDADVPLYCSTECKLRDGQARAGLPMRYDPHSDFAEISHSTLMPALRRTDTDGSLTSSCGSDDSTDASPLLTFARAPPSYGREKHQRDMERVEKIKATAARQGLPNGKVAYAQVKPELYRSVVYGLTTPLVDHTGNELLTGPDAEEHAMAPYRSQISTARRSSVGIVSSATRDVQGPRPSPTRTVFEPSSAPTISSWPRSESDQDLLSGFHATLGRRSQSRCNLYSLSSSPTSPTVTHFPDQP
ncbi:hypothetical protein DL96DRAFT_169389 [Flagelloscypha sp. PMI_526]|nr:hypothetical protein DL96DRAFT_169389 [Flagelloscypha sp. PMI_526]